MPIKYIDIAYKTTNYHVFNRYGTFSRRCFRFLLNITGGLTSLRLKTIVPPSIQAPSVAPVSNSDYNKRWSLDLNDSECKLEKQYSSLVSHGSSAISTHGIQWNTQRNNVLIHCVTSQNYLL